MHQQPDPYQLSIHLEQGLASHLESHRFSSCGLSSTRWDTGLAHLLMPALVAYEYVSPLI